MKHHSSNGFTLIELMIVVAIIAILAAIAIPQYQNYVMRSQLTRVVAELTNLKIHAEPCINDGWLVVGAGPQECDIGAIRSNLLAAEPTITLSATGHITGTMGQTAMVALAGTVIDLKRSAEGAWTCEITTSKPSLIPQGCSPP